MSLTEFLEALDSATVYKYCRAMLENLQPEQSPLYNKGDDIAAGKLFADTFKTAARYHDTARNWYVYNGGIWSEDREGLTVDLMAKQLQRALIVYSAERELGECAFKTMANALGKIGNRRHMIEDARAFYPIHSGELDRQDNMLCVQNGVLCLDTGELLPHSPDLLLSRRCNAAYDPDADRTTVERFIREVMDGDTERAAYLQAVFGYALTGTCGQEECYLLYGATTRNGKSTLCDTFEFMLGGYGAHIQPETLALKDRNSRNASSDVARLEGIRYLHCSEPPKRMQLDVALLKTLTGRDTITARALYQAEREFVPKFKLLINTNYLPLVTDDTVFSSGRIRVIPFTRHFTPQEQDVGLKDRLREQENLSALLNWALAGLHQMQAHGGKLVPPASVIAATEEYRRSSDKLGQFMADCFIEEPTAAITAGEAYRAYGTWCEANGYGTENKGNFMAELRSRKLLRATATVHGRTVRNVIVGWSLDTDQWGNLRENPFAS